MKKEEGTGNRNQGNWRNGRMICSFEKDETLIIVMGEDSKNRLRERLGQGFLWEEQRQRETHIMNESTERHKPQKAMEQTDRQTDRQTKTERQTGEGKGMVCYE